MKHTLTLLSIAALTAAAPAFAQQPRLPQGNPGIMISGTASQTVGQLPQPAQDFLAKYYKYKEIKKCERDYPSGKYEVELRDGTDIEFASDGKRLEDDAPDYATLAPEMLKDIIAPNAYKEIENRGYLKMIEAVERTRDGGYKVEVAKVVDDEIIFDINGTLIAIRD